MPRRDPEVGVDDDKSALSNDAPASSTVSTQAVLNFIDLAGSERASIHDASSSSTSVPIGASVRNPSNFGSTHRSSSNNKQTNMNLNSQRVREGQHINKSLFYLTQVISRQAEG